MESDQGNWLFLRVSDRTLDSLTKIFHSAKRKVVGELCHVFVHKVIASSVKQILRIKICGAASYICYWLHCSNLGFHRVLNTFNSSFYHFCAFPEIHTDTSNMLSDFPFPF